MSKYKTTGKQTLFDAENAARKLSEIGNPLEKLDSVIDFEMFRRNQGDRSFYTRFYPQREVGMLSGKCL